LVCERWRRGSGNTGCRRRSAGRAHRTLKPAILVVDLHDNAGLEPRDTFGIVLRVLRGVEVRQRHLEARLLHFPDACLPSQHAKDRLTSLIHGHVDSPSDEVEMPLLSRPGLPLPSAADVASPLLVRLGL